MTYDPGKHHRRSLRLRGYDYRQAGAYFVTICTQRRQYVLGDVKDGRVVLSGAGEMVECVWRELPEHYAGVAVDAFVVMPNHLHGIVMLVGTGAFACPDDLGQPRRVAVGQSGQPQGVAPTLSLPHVVHRFKSLTTARYRHGVRQNGWRPFAGRLWQRNYHERIIRNDRELDAIRRYIEGNPSCWAEDSENPSAVGVHGHAPLHRTTRPGERLVR